MNGNYEPSNCRWADNETQCINQRIRKDNKTGYKGIYIEKGVYRVKIKRNKKVYYGGSYKNLNDAVKALARVMALADEAQQQQQDSGLFGDE